MSFQYDQYLDLIMVGKYALRTINQSRNRMNIKLMMPISMEEIVLIP